ncbi:hypothetical protein [Halopenitus persicus]|uniref:hypothetical protein n=1 Tax=Halopenitus persicus TaxID=1048396 RepID=UPI000BBA889A|nr:hypothetical protein [Halopenitus persicus]
MTDSPSDTELFAEWVSETAESRGVTEQELLNQLISSFWVLDELDGIRGEGGTLGEVGRPEESDPTESDVLGFADPTHDPESGTDEADGTGENGETDGTGENGETDRTGENGETDRTGETGDAVAPDDAAGDGSAAPGEVDVDLQNVLHGLLETLRADSPETDGSNDLRRQIHDLSLDVEDQRRRHERYTDRISDDLTRINGRLTTLEEDADDFVTEADLARYATEDALDREIEGLEDEVNGGFDELEGWIDEEFDEIEALFEHLLDRIDDLDGRIDAVDDRVDDVGATVESTVESELESIRSKLAENERLAALRRDAIADGIRSADCAGCGETVDLAMLDAPQCPNCTATFRDVEPAGWNPFGSPTLQTGTPDPPFDAADGARVEEPHDDPSDGDR